MRKSFFWMFLLFQVCIACAQSTEEGYTKIERMIPMRDGIKLFTAIYIPKDTTANYPILMYRTPYSVSPYGEDKMRNKLGPNSLFSNEKYIYVYQDVRGRHRSEGNFREMTPAITNKRSNKEVDESSDTYDTIEWLLNHIENTNKRVGLYGISYPGFYATASLPHAHPAIKAVSPQAPVTDEFEGDDVYHRGAFFLMDNFSFLNFFDQPRPVPVNKNKPINTEIEMKNAYDFYLKTGALKNYNDDYFFGKSKIWNEYLTHSTKDTFWMARDIRTHLKNVKPATFVVGGWFDAEDLFGALHTYRAIEQQNKNNDNRLIMGPWSHGAWAKNEWTKFDLYEFGSNTNKYFQKMEFDFFNYFLKEKGNFDAAEATVFITGKNEWQSFSQWPPKEIRKEAWYLNENHSLLLYKGILKGWEDYISDPANPFPYTNKVSKNRVSSYMVEDQSFAAERPDVLYFVSAILDKDITVCGPIKVKLNVSLTGTDADFVVKLIDVLPDSSETQRMVRAEVLRGKFRNSFTKPEPFIPGKITPVTFELNDMAHSFLKGHKIMIQIQSSWFPLVDRNPQQFMEIPKANDDDFNKQTIRIYHSKKYPSSIEVNILPE